MGSLFQPVRSQVEFRGPISYSHIRDLYAEHDICLFGSLCESFGMPLVEAMTMNMPVVATDADWARERCGPAGLYATTESPGAWADKIEDIVIAGWRRNPEGLVRKEQYDWDLSRDLYATLLLDSDDDRSF